MVKVTIDGFALDVPDGTTVLEAAKRIGVRIPTLCAYEGLAIHGGCRLCIVEVEGTRNLPAACALPVREGMNVKTHSPRVLDARRDILQLILASHPADCKTCDKHGRCELQTLSYEFGIRDFGYPMRDKRHYLDDSSPAIWRDLDKCILCGRCVRACRDWQSVGVYDFANRGTQLTVTPAFLKNMIDTSCVACGQCTIVCPTGALSEAESVTKVRELLASGKRVVAQVAPSIRVSLGELFGQPPGTLVTGKIVTALRRIGFADVFDTNLGADVTIVEEASELVASVKTGRTHLASSCCPAWINFIEEYYPDLLSYLSSCKSPQSILGALAKSYYAQKLGLKPSEVAVVSVMPCTAKKWEAQRGELAVDGVPDVDAILTTRELARLIREEGIDFNALPDSDFDSPLGISSGAGAIFGTTGGVTEAALRTAYEFATGKTLGKVEFEQVRGFANLKEATVDFDGVPVKIAVTHTLGAARSLLESLRQGKHEYQFVEVMACPGGCVGGGGQPIPPREHRVETIRKRAQALYDLDRSLLLRKSHENPAVKQLYAEFLTQPLSPAAHKYLHTTYTARRGDGR